MFFQSELVNLSSKRFTINLVVLFGIFLLPTLSFATDGNDDIVWQNVNGQVHYWPMSNGQRVSGIDIHSPVGTSWHLRGVGDVNGDDTDDIVWQNINGQVHYWPMSNGQRTDGIDIHSPVSTSWHLRGVGNVDE